MKILFVSDVPDKALWDYFQPSRTEGVELIISCGDLPTEYLEFLVTMVNRPLLYVHGNHDGRYEQHPPQGCQCIDDKVVTAGGLRILGLGGSMRYKPDSPHMYTEPEMRRRIWRMGFSLRRSRGIDLLVTHAPALGYGDMEDLPHQGFACFNDLLMAHQPALMAFGHVHQDYGHFRRTLDHPSGARLLNAWQSFVLDTEEL